VTSERGSERIAWRVSDRSERRDILTERNGGSTLETKRTAEHLGVGRNAGQTPPLEPRRFDPALENPAARERGEVKAVTRTSVQTFIRFTLHTNHTHHATTPGLSHLPQSLVARGLGRVPGPEPPPTSVHALLDLPIFIPVRPAPFVLIVSAAAAERGAGVPQRECGCSNHPAEPRRGGPAARPLQREPPITAPDEDASRLVAAPPPSARRIRAPRLAAHVRRDDAGHAAAPRTSSWKTTSSTPTIPAGPCATCSWQGPRRRQVRLSWTRWAGGTWPLVSTPHDRRRVEVVFFIRICPSSGDGGNFRNHRKIVVIDGWTFTAARTTGTKQRPQAGRVAHTHERNTGPAVHHLQKIYHQDWFFACNRQNGQDLQVYFPLPDSPGDHLVQVVPSGPDREASVLHMLLIGAIGAARERLSIATPYFVPDHAMIVALQSAAYRGVRVRLLIPSQTDHKIVLWAGRSFYREIRQSGTRIRVRPGHAALEGDHRGRRLPLVGSAIRRAQAWAQLRAIGVLTSATWPAASRDFEAWGSRPSRPLPPEVRHGREPQAGLGPLISRC